MTPWTPFTIGITARSPPTHRGALVLMPAKTKNKHPMKNLRNK